MSNQELLTFLFNAIALGFLGIAAVDFGTRAVTVYKQASFSSILPLTSAQQPISELPLATTLSRVLPQLPDPWLLPSPIGESVGLVKSLQKKQKHLRLLPQATETSIVTALKLEDLLTGIDLNKLKIRQARKIAKALGIAQKVNGRDRKLASLVGQIKSSLQQAKSEIVEVIKQELIAC